MKREKHLETIIILSVALGICYWIWRNNYFLFGAGTLAIIGLFLPFIAAKIHWIWMKFSNTLGFFMSKFLLTLIYIIFLIPISLLSKIFGAKTGIKLKAPVGSNFTDRNFTYSKESMDNSW